MRLFGILFLEAQGEMELSTPLTPDAQLPDPLIKTFDPVQSVKARYIRQSMETAVDLNRTEAQRSIAGF